MWTNLSVWVSITACDGWAQRFKKILSLMYLCTAVFTLKYYIIFDTQIWYQWNKYTCRCSIFEGMREFTPSDFKNSNDMLENFISYLLFILFMYGHGSELPNTEITSRRILVL